MADREGMGQVGQKPTFYFYNNSLTPRLQMLNAYTYQNICFNVIFPGGMPNNEIMSESEPCIYSLTNFLFAHCELCLCHV